MRPWISTDLDFQGFSALQTIPANRIDDGLFLRVWLSLCLRMSRQGSLHAFGSFRHWATSPSQFAPLNSSHVFRSEEEGPALLFAANLPSTNCDFPSLKPKLDVVPKVAIVSVVTISQVEGVSRFVIFILPAPFVM